MTISQTIGAELGVPIITRPELRNLAIIAHVDHGKTTLVDHLLRQANVFRENQVVNEQVMDSNALERERGMTILAKQTGVVWQGTRINIIDTPGHADFSGEVERVLGMADGCLLLVDAAEGPMPQTRSVLKKALAGGLRTIVVVNKCDRPDARIEAVVNETQELFLELATDAEQLDFPIVYAIGKFGRAGLSPDTIGDTLESLFATILDYIPPPSVPESGPLQLLVSNLDYDTHLGTIAIGRIARGELRPGSSVVVVSSHGVGPAQKVATVFGFEGLKRVPLDSAWAGDLVALTGVDGPRIGQTIADTGTPEALPEMRIEDPTVRMTFGVNTSPMAGREGKFLTSRQIRARLWRELEVNVGLRVSETDSADVFLVAGRGELHLSILIETLRREGYELQVSRPEAVTRIEDGHHLEPIELLTVDTLQEHVGTVTELASTRLGQLVNLQQDAQGGIRMEYRIPTRGLIGLRNNLLTSTRGNVVVSSELAGYERIKGEVTSMRSGALVAWEPGSATTYGLNNAQERGVTYVDAGTEVYEGMIVGQQPRDNDLAVNVCKEKKLTNIRSSTSDIAIRLSPPVKLSLEQMLDFLGPDDLLEVTPNSLRMRKRILNTKDRQSAQKREG